MNYILFTVLMVLVVGALFFRIGDKSGQKKSASRVPEALPQSKNESGRGIHLTPKFGAIGMVLKGLPYGKILLIGAVIAIIFFPDEFEERAGRSVTAIVNTFGTTWTTLSAQDTVRQGAVIMVQPEQGVFLVKVPHGTWTSSYQAPKGLSLHYMGDNQYTGTFKEECQSEYWDSGSKKCTRVRLFGTDKKGRDTPVYLVAK